MRRHIPWICLSLGTFLAALLAALQFHPRLFSTYNAWFDGDFQRVLMAMTRLARPTRSYYHPLFPFLTQPVVSALRGVFGVGDLGAVRIDLALIAATWTAFVYRVLNRITERVFDSIVFSLLAVASAASVFWLPVPETWALGSISILIALALALGKEGEGRSFGLLVLVNAIGFGTTLTNGIPAALVTILRVGPRRAARVLIVTLVILSVALATEMGFGRIATGQLGDKAAPNGALISKTFDLERTFLRNPTLERLRDVSGSLFLNSIVAAVPTAESGSGGKSYVRMRGIAQGTAGRAAIGIWIALLLAGIVASLSIVRDRSARRRPFTAVLLAAILVQLLIHVFYGPEPFLYVLHVSPLLVILTSLGTRTRFRWVVVLLALVLVPLLLVHNISMFLRAIRLVADATGDA